MKTKILLLIIFTGYLCQAQELTYEESQDMEFCAGISNGSDFTSYIAQDGSTIKIGSSLTIGRPSANSNKFTTIFIGKMSNGGILLSPRENLTSPLQYDSIVVNRIYVYHSRASKKSQLIVRMNVKNLKAYKISTNLIITDYEWAVVLGEIINPSKQF